MNESIAISRVHYPISTLGPGQRIGIWFQGCSIRCEGCISVDTWKENTGIIAINTLIQKIALYYPHTDGITISGGEPFDQFPALLRLLRTIREQWHGDILVYSGYDYDKIKAQVAKLDNKIDALISGPFISGEKQTLALRGSDNQQLHYLTALGRERFSVYQSSPQITHKSLDLMFDEQGVAWMAGIPQQKDMLLLKSLLQDQGHQISITEQAMTTTKADKP